MIISGDLSPPARATTEPVATVERGRIHPRLNSHLAQLNYTEDGVPDRESWDRIIGLMSEYFAETDQLSRDLVENMRGRSSFENLFRMSPVPLIEQDYTELEEWMDQLRSQGVTDIRAHLGEDVEAIRAIVPMIRIVAANPAAVRAVGLALDDLIGPIDPLIVNEGSQPSWLSQLEAIWNRQPEAHAAFTAATAEGHSYDAESTLAAPLVLGEPDFSRAVFTLVDVTPHRNEERRMQEMIEAKNRFLASVSHEIRTPLTALLGYGRLLEEDFDLTDDDRRLMISSITQHAQEVADLIEDLLVAARAEMGQIEVVRKRVDLMEEIEQTLDAGGSFTTNVTVEQQVNSPQAWGDPARIRQILRNLLTNAERYGGDHVSVIVWSRDGQACIDVTDDGPGLPDGEWDRIFEPYQRAHVSPGQPDSVGIGLTISRQLAEMMGGSLQYLRVGKMSVFRLALEIFGS